MNDNDCQNVDNFETGGSLETHKGAQCINLPTSVCV